MACPTHLPLLAISLLWLSSCGGGDAVAELRSAVLITLDTTTPDSLDVYGSNIGVTPHLSALAERAVVFEVARTVAPLKPANDAYVIDSSDLSIEEVTQTILARVESTSRIRLQEPE